MLDSVKIAKRQSEIRQAIAPLAGKTNPTEDEVRQMGDLDREYSTNETRYRAALIAEDTERREAGADLETRSGKEWADLMGRFEVRQIVHALDTGKMLSGQTAEIVTELRNRGSFQGMPVPLAALEQRAGETTSGGITYPGQLYATVARLFPASVAAKMGAATINVDVGDVWIPVTSSSVTAGWAGEADNVPGPVPYTEETRTLKPDHNLGVHMRITRNALKYSGQTLEQSIRSDMLGTIGAELDKAVFLGTGVDGQPLGVITGAADYGITEQAVSAAASWSAFRAAVVAFMTGNAAAAASDVLALIRPEVWSKLDDTLIAGTAVSEWDRLTGNIPAGNIAMSANALAAPAASATTALLTTGAGGIPPITVGIWGAIDVIRDPFSDAQSGGLRLTALTTVDVAVARPAQLRVLTGVQI
ncbi:phage major capsid protein [Paenirhodobacter populi]|uniref:Phage major capsid protein n=1 Tax=Paenirhodobacter populi TaxID=2306993 RepID=A0A443JJQ2_9RHOB|nr:phage major capsid protein [Sinirhodobacter populi]RWR20812.1 phage major capsid protein [Sinirhodobacter populi]